VGCHPCVLGGVMGGCVIVFFPLGRIIVIVCFDCMFSSMHSHDSILCELDRLLLDLELDS
jgi:hypothetical protein